MKKALVFYGGWDGHDPENVAKLLSDILEKSGYSVIISGNYDELRNAELVNGLDLIVPCVTMSDIPGECVMNISNAVADGTGLAGCHGGMCDSFRNDTEWQFLTGGQFVAHPGGETEYTVNIKDKSNPLTFGIDDFKVKSEQYYMHIDPAIEIHATTKAPVASGNFSANRQVDMPVVWTKYWGKGKVYYCSLGHNSRFFADYPQALELMKNGMLWASK